jgi:hypothetical protein
MEMAVERTRIERGGLAQVELVKLMSVLVSAAANCGAEAVRGTHLPSMVTSMFWGPGPLVCALVPVEMLPPCAEPASGVGVILALIFAARKHHAGLKWVAQAASLHVLVQ